jgi:hypothetical protein
VEGDPVPLGVEENPHIPNFIGDQLLRLQHFAPGSLEQVKRLLVAKSYKFGKPQKAFFKKMLKKQHILLTSAFGGANILAC